MKWLDKIDKLKPEKWIYLPSIIDTNESKQINI